MPGRGEREQRFEAVAHQVWQPLAAYFRRRADPADVDDLVEEVLVVLWRRLDDVPAEGAVPYAYRTAAHCLANHRRGRLRHLRLLQRLRDEPVVPVPDGDERLAEALVRLSPAEREVLRLWAWEGLEARDLATVLGCTPNAATLRLSRARAALRKAYRQDPAAPGQEQQREDTVHRP